ncbi:hypothetical protein KQUDLBSD_CDS0215 [Staphylococcus phage PG-2021_40]
MIQNVRAWDKVNKEMIEDVASIHFKTEMIVTSKLCFYPFKDIEFLQSTGLFDKNGTEIFEGDILKVFVLGDEGVIAKVIFKNGMFGIEDDMYGYGYDKGLYSLHQILSLRDAEILGNKFEHPHLLGEE